jgi:AraC family transcriptional regulator, regulatory protein of adaptative response / methylated-DNA-[protein]-cysteine methyltransferase
MTGNSPAKLDAGYDSDSGIREAVTRIIENSSAASKGSEPLKSDWIETPIGAMLAVADAKGLHLLKFFDGRALQNELKRLQEMTRSSIAFGRLPPIDSIANELRAYFSGVSAVFKTPLACHGSAFTCKVWDALKAIPLGSTRSYSEIARDVEQPSSTRAVGRANGANQIVIVIPCHRVIGADGSLTGYGGGLWRKRWLLEHEHRMTARRGGETTDGT